MCPLLHASIWYNTITPDFRPPYTHKHEENALITLVDEPHKGSCNDVVDVNEIEKVNAQIKLESSIRETSGVGIENVALTVQHAKESEENNTTHSRYHNGIRTHRAKSGAQKVVALVCHVHREQTPHEALHGPTTDVEVVRGLERLLHVQDAKRGRLFENSKQNIDEFELSFDERNDTPKEHRKKTRDNQINTNTHQHHIPKVLKLGRADAGIYEAANKAGHHKKARGDVHMKNVHGEHDAVERGRKLCVCRRADA